jgi:organic hydroperoxide reductase OsmC/OhrA
MPAMTVELRSIPDTGATVAWAGNHTIVVDRPEGKAGGMGLGFNGGQLLGLALGGCFCNDLHYVAHEQGVSLTSIRVTVTVQFEGAPLLATRAAIEVDVTASDLDVDLAGVIRRAREISTVSNSVQRGFPVEIGSASRVR